MSGSHLQVTIDDATLLATLAKLSAAAHNPKPAYADVGEYLVRTTWDRFDAQKGPDGQAWKALQTGTLLLKKLDKILMETSRLRDSVTYRADDEGVAVGSNVVYSAIHQFGGVIRPKKAKALWFPMGFQGGGAGMVMAASVTIPARPYLGLSGEDGQEVLTILSEWLEKAMA